MAAANIKKGQVHYKQQYDRHATSSGYRMGDLVLVKFPHEESGRNRKLSRPWHGPYRVIQCNEPDLTVVKQFFPEQGSIQIHQLRVCPCPVLPIGFYWYGANSHSAGSVPRWVEKLTQSGVQATVVEPGEEDQELSDTAVEPDEEQEQSDKRESESRACNMDESQHIECTDQDDPRSTATSPDVGEEQPSDVPRYQLRNRLTRRAPDRYLQQVQVRDKFSVKGKSDVTLLDQ